MKIVKKQTYRINLVLAISLTMFSTLIYWLYKEFRQDEFYDYLTYRAVTLQKLLIDEKISGDQLRYMQQLQQDIFSQKEFVIYDTTGTVLYKSDLATPHLTEERTRGVLEGEIEFVKDGYERIFFVTQDNSVKRKLIIEAGGYDTAGLNNQRKLLYTLVGGSVVMIVVVAFSTQYYVKKYLDPLQQIARRMENISGNNFKNYLPEAELNNEIGQMSRSFNSLISRLEAAYTQQLNFVSYATHELRTPLAILLGNAQVTLMKKRTPKEYVQTIEAFQTDINRMNKLVDSLLQLARINVEAANIPMTDVRVDDVLWMAVDAVKQQLTDAKITVEFGDITGDTESFVTLGNAELLALAFRNIIENACKYSEDQSVVIRLTNTTHRVQLNFIDHGEGISTEETEHIFEPFYRIEKTQEIRGHGIGLPLTKRIITVHNGDISLTSAVGEGSNFQLTLAVKK